MFTKNIIVLLLSGSVILFAPLANAELVINSSNKQYNSLKGVDTRQIPNDESIKQLMDLYDYEESIDLIVGNSEEKKQAVINAVYSSMGVDVTQIDNLTVEQKNKIANFNDVLGEYADYIFENRKEEMLEIYKQAFRQALRQTYTQEEIEAQINFYSTPIGYGIMKKQPIFTKINYESAYPQIMAIQNQNIQEAIVKLAEDVEVLKDKNN